MIKYNKKFNIISISRNIFDNKIFTKVDRICSFRISECKPRESKNPLFFTTGYWVVGSGLGLKRKKLCKEQHLTPSKFNSVVLERNRKEFLKKENGSTHKRSHRPLYQRISRHWFSRQSCRSMVLFSHPFFFFFWRFWFDSLILNFFGGIYSCSCIYDCFQGLLDFLCCNSDFCYWLWIQQCKKNVLEFYRRSSRLFHFSMFACQNMNS